MLTAHSPPLRAALDRLWATAAVDYGLIPELELETVLARARTGDGDEVSVCLPRLVDALVDGELSPVTAIDVIELLDDHIGSGAAKLLDAWWADVLERSPGEHRSGLSPEPVLGLLAHTRAPMVRWLHPWLEALDGPPAVHLAAAIVDGFPSPTWAGRSDERQQVMAWTRSETVINGLALIGATHVDNATMSRVLDILILGEDESRA